MVFEIFLEQNNKLILLGTVGNKYNQQYMNIYDVYWLLYLVRYFILGYAFGRFKIVN